MAWFQPWSFNGVRTDDTIYHSDLIQVFRQQIVRLVRCCFCSQGFHDLAKKISQNLADLGPSSAWDYSGCHKRKFEEEGGGVCGKVVRWENFWKKTWAICFAWSIWNCHIISSYNHNLEHRIARDKTLKKCKIYHSSWWRSPQTIKLTLLFLAQSV